MKRRWNNTTRTWDRDDRESTCFSLLGMFFFGCRCCQIFMIPTKLQPWKSHTFSISDKPGLLELVHTKTCPTGYSGCQWITNSTVLLIVTEMNHWDFCFEVLQQDIVGNFLSCCYRDLLFRLGLSRSFYLLSHTVCTTFVVSWIASIQWQLLPSKLTMTATSWSTRICTTTTKSSLIFHRHILDACTHKYFRRALHTTWGTVISK